MKNKKKMFFSVLFSLCLSENKYFSLDEEIVQTEYCGKNGATIDFFPPFQSKFLFVVNSIDDGVKMAVHSPSTASGQAIDPRSNNSILFTTGNSKVSFTFSQDDQCVRIASVGLPECSSGVEVVTQMNYERKIEPQRNQDFCIFYAASSGSLSWRSKNTQLGSDKVTVYNSVTSGQSYVTLKNTDQSSTQTRTGWLFRYESTSTETGAEKGCTLSLMAGEVSDKAVQLVSTPMTFTVNADKPERNAFFPILGTVCPVALLVVWIITFIKLYRKSPVEGTITLVTKA